jgi:hypothetical protein
MRTLAARSSAIAGGWSGPSSNTKSGEPERALGLRPKRGAVTAEVARRGQMASRKTRDPFGCRP